MVPVIGLPFVSERGVALERARHAAATAAPAPEFEAFDRDHFDAGLTQRRVRAGVAFVSDDGAGLERDDVVAVVPLLALRLERVAAGRDDAHLLHPERLAHDLR